MLGPRIIVEVAARWLSDFVKTPKARSHRIVLVGVLLVTHVLAQPLDHVAAYTIFVEVVPTTARPKSVCLPLGIAG
jgi:uncharacterized protein involved in response to NO